MYSSIEEVRKYADKVRRSKPWWMLVSAYIFLGMTVLALFTSGLVKYSPLFACAFAGCAAAFYAMRAAKLNLELVEKIEKLEQRIDKLQGNTP